VQRNWARALKASGVGLSEPQARILANLWRQEGGLTQTQLATELGMEKAPLGRLLDRMEDGGYVERHPDPTDRRARRVIISKQGIAAIPNMQRVTRQVFAEAFKGVSAHKIDVMLDVLDDLKSNLSPLEADMDGPPSKNSSEPGE
ncbi:MAG: MarR family transcriptional regulator, partial [Rhodobacteraceae bacterium]|nr:MarR family transcriptional regulator [Paracoccaceae bacterium]